MADLNRDGVDDTRPVERTTIVNNDRGGGGSGAITAIVLILALLALAYVFRDRLGFSGTKVPDSIDINVNTN